ncbi:conserved hypothetical protein [Vibrio diabolicus]|nr:conserved hypothetical protein [Vibrio diabolicus]
MSMQVVARANCMLHSPVFFRKLRVHTQEKLKRRLAESPKFNTLSSGSKILESKLRSIRYTDKGEVWFSIKIRQDHQ